VVCFKQVNRCYFDCQVHAIFAGPNVTFYITQSGRVYGTGHWKCFVNSLIPVCISSICQTWKLKQIAVSKNQIVLVGYDGCIFGLGDNSLGELGLCHVDCIKKPVPLSFFYMYNLTIAKQLTEACRHPIEKKYLEGSSSFYKHCSKCQCEPCKCDFYCEERDCKKGKCKNPCKDKECGGKSCKCNSNNEERNDNYNNNYDNHYNDNEDRYGVRYFRYGRERCERRRYIPNYKVCPFRGK